MVVLLLAVVLHCLRGEHRRWPLPQCATSVTTEYRPSVKNNDIPGRKVRKLVANANRTEKEP